MKKILLVFLFVAFSQSTNALTIQQVIISPTTGSNINVHLKVFNGYMFQYHEHSYVIENNTITLTVCYNPITLSSVTILENDFELENINLGITNYDLIIIVKKRYYNNGQYLCDSLIDSDTETLSFSAPLIQTLTLSSDIFNDKINEFILFPNPTNGLLEFKNDDKTIHTIKVYDELGRLVQIFDSISSEIIVLKSLEDGIYLIEFNTEKGKFIKKIILKK